METKDIILELHKKRGLFQDELDNQSHGHKTGGISLGKRRDDSQYGDIKTVI